MLIHEEVLHYHLTVNSLITLALQTEVRALKNTICNMNMETIKMLALWIKIIWIEMVDSTYPEIKKLKIQIYNCLLFTDSYSSSNLSTKINLIRKNVPSQAPEKHTIPFLQEMYKGNLFVVIHDQCQLYTGCHGSITAHLKSYCCNKLFLPTN